MKSKKKKQTRVDWRAAFMYLFRATTGKNYTEEVRQEIISRYRKEFRK